MGWWVGEGGGGGGEGCGVRLLDHNALTCIVSFISYHISELFLKISEIVLEVGLKGSVSQVSDLGSSFDCMLFRKKTF